MDLRWYVCDLVTGTILDELPLTASGPVRRRIALVESTTLTLNVFDPKCPPDWTSTLINGKTMLVLTIDDQPTQAWAVIDHTVGEVTVPINVSTLEVCADRTNVPDLDPYDLPDLDYSVLAAALVEPLLAGFGFTLETETAGKRFEGDQTYSTAEDRKILTALNEDIMGADGGPEWRMFVRWTDADHRGFTKVLEIRPRIGADRPDAVFDLDTNGRGTIESYRRTPSFAAGKGATMLIGTSEGIGDSRPVTDPVVSDLVAAGWPVWEERKNFPGLGQGVLDEDTELDARTRALLRQRERGSTTWTVTGRDTGPMPGRDFNEGDTVRVVVAPNPPVDPDGGTVSPRTLGWELDVVSKQVTPLLWDNSEETSDG